MLTVLAFLLTLTVLIAVHEFGHFWVAKRNGVKVIRFAIGFGKPLWTRQFGTDNTEFAVCMLPLGGYVKMLDEREAPVDASEVHRAFNRQSVWVRMKVVLAGPFANFLLAIVLYAIVMMVGVNDVAARLGDVAQGSFASRAGFKADDLITAVEGAPVRSWEDWRSEVLDKVVDRKDVSVTVMTRGDVEVERILPLSAMAETSLDDHFFDRLGFSPLHFNRTLAGLVRGDVADRAGLKTGDEIIALNDVPAESGADLIQQIRNSPGKPLKVTYMRAGVQRSVVLVPRVVGSGLQAVGRIGVAPSVDEDSIQSRQITVRLGLPDAVLASLDKTWRLSRLSIVMMWKMLIGQASLDNLGGTLTIAKVAGQAASYGIVPFIEFLCFVSIGLGVLNLLPIPVLDGGHFMYYVAELFKGSPVSVRTQEIGQYIGGALLLSLMTFALYNDIQRLFLNA